MHFRLTPRSMNLDDLESLTCHKFGISHDLGNLGANNGRANEDRHRNVSDGIVRY